MGMSVSAKIVVGYTYDEIYAAYEKWEETVDAGDCHFYEWKEDNDLTTVFPYYDAPYTDCLFGAIITASEDYSYKTFNLNEAEIEGVTQTLTEQFGIEPKLYLTPYVR